MLILCVLDKFFENRWIVEMLYGILCVTKAKEVTYMAKITIEELFYGDKYGVMGEVVKQVFARQGEFVADPHTFRELEIVRQTLIAVEKMKKNGDCIAEEELGDRSPFLYLNPAH